MTHVTTVTHHSMEKEHTLTLIHFHSLFLEDALQAILHTLIFVRAPGQVRATDHQCIQLSPLMYSSCNLPSVDESIQSAIELVKNSLAKHNRQHNPIMSSSHSVPGNPCFTPTPLSSSPTRVIPYQFDIIVSFFDRKEVKEYFGMVSRTENSYFEHWRIPVSIIDSPMPTSGGPTTPEFQQYYTIAYNCVSNSIMALIEVSSIFDFVP